jgi:hypothetical protein
MAAVSSMVLGTVHYPKYLSEGITDCLKKIVKKRVMAIRGSFAYTLCYLEPTVDGQCVAGEMVKLASETKEKYFDQEKWEPIEFQLGGKKLVIGSRFLLSPENFIVIEDKRPDLTRTTFSRMLTALLAKTLDDPVFTLQITFHKDPIQIQKFIKEQDRIVRISMSRILLKNPLFDKNKIDKALKLIQELNMSKGRMENPEKGLNKESDIFGGLVGLAEQGQLDMSIQGVSEDRPGTKRMFMTKQKLLVERVKIEGDVGSFSKEAWDFLNKHRKRMRE